MGMKWAEIRIHTSAEATEAVANIFHEAGANGVVIEDAAVMQQPWPERFGETFQLDPKDYPEEGVIVKAYLPENPSLPEKIRTIREKVNALAQHGLSLGPNQFSVETVDETDWANEWKKYYKPLHVTERITVKPVWETYTPRTEQELIIEMDPGMAFGTGTHPSTKLAMQALEKHVQPGDAVADVGCGSGILSILAAKLGASRVLALDLDEVAVDATRQNAAINDMTDRIDVRQNHLLDGVTETFDVIVANIIADVIIRMAPTVPQRLKPNGWFIASGIIAAKREEVVEVLHRNGLQVRETMRMEDWIALCAQRH